MMLITVSQGIGLMASFWAPFCLDQHHCQHCRIHSEGLFVEPEVSVVVPLHFFAVFPTIQLLYKYLELNTHTLIDNFL